SVKSSQPAMERKSSPTEKDVSLLISFLADPNEQTVTLAKKQLRTILHQFPGFRDLLEKAPDPNLAQEARLFLEETRLAELESAFRELGKQGEKLDLEEGVYRLATLAYPSLERSTVSNQLDEIAQDMEEILDAQEPSPSQAIALLRTYMFEEMGFQGNQG